MSDQLPEPAPTRFRQTVSAVVKARYWAPRPAGDPADAGEPG